MKFQERGNDVSSGLIVRGSSGQPPQTADRRTVGYLKGNLGGKCGRAAITIDESHRFFAAVASRVSPGTGEDIINSPFKVPVVVDATVHNRRSRCVRLGENCELGQSRKWTFSS